MNTPHTIKPEVKVTEELTKTLWLAQLRHIQEHTAVALEYEDTGDDGYDYLRGALILGQWLTEIWFERDVKRLSLLLNMPHGTSDLSDIACDGICKAIYDLDPRALDLDEEEATTTP